MRLQQLRETRSRLARDIEEIRSAWTGRTGEMPGDVQERLDRALTDWDNNEREIRMEEINARMSQPDNSGGALVGGEMEVEHQQRAAGAGLFGQQLRHFTGFQSSLTPEQARDMQADINTNGGFLMAPRTTVNRLIETMDSELIFRQLATVESNVGLNGMGTATREKDLDDADWTGELTAASASELKFGERELKPKILKKLVTIGNELLQRATYDVEGYVLSRMARKFAVPQEFAFMQGDGRNKPLGIFIADPDGISTARDVETSTSLALKADDFIDLQHKIKSGYRSRAVWVLHDDVLKYVRKLKDNNGQYLWAPLGNESTSFAMGLVGTILGRPYYTSDYAPNSLAAGAYPVVFGDISRYQICDAGDLKIQRLNELFALNGKTGFIGHNWTDGAPEIEEAFARLKVKA